MGRSKKVLTADDIKRREKSAERVKALKIKLNISYKTLADRVGLSEATIRNYVHKRSAMDSRVARLFQNQTGVIWPYWLGETDCTSWEEYQNEQSDIEAAVLSEIEKEEQKKKDHYSALFSLCDFQYSNLEYTPEYEFNTESPGPHRITDTETGITATLSDSELQTLIDRLRSTIQVECFIKSKQA